MKQRIFNRIKRLFQHNAIVLMYHRIAEPDSDIWDITVSPKNFDQQLQLLKKTKNVISATELVERINCGKIEKNSIVITFDDGYADNYSTAKPLLEKYCLPSTFFIASANIGTDRAFWWDELEDLFLFSNHLPQLFSMAINNWKIEVDLTNEAILSEDLRMKHQSWKACEEKPPSLRSSLFLEAWKELKPLPIEQQQKQMQSIREWAGTSKVVRDEFKSMSKEQLKKLAGNKLFEIGAHTTNHAALASHTKEDQRNELITNLCFLKETTGSDKSILSYPYGNYNNVTTETVNELGLKVAFTTEEHPVGIQSHKHRLGRFQVQNWGCEDFQKKLNYWSSLKS